MRVIVQIFSGDLLAFDVNPLLSMQVFHDLVRAEYVRVIDGDAKGDTQLFRESGEIIPYHPRRRLNPSEEERFYLFFTDTQYRIVFHEVGNAIIIEEEEDHYTLFHVECEPIQPSSSLSLFLLPCLAYRHRQDKEHVFRPYMHRNIVDVQYGAIDQMDEYILDMTGVPTYGIEEIPTFLRSRGFSECVADRFPSAWLAYVPLLRDRRRA